jgi:hypothetical protein
MKMFCFILLMLATAMVSVAAPASEEKKSAPPRLTQIDAFPEKYRDAVRAVIAALSAASGKPEEYFGAFTLGKEGLLEVHLTHQSHPVDSRWLGDECGRCRIAFYDPKTGKILKFQGIR